MVSSHTFVSFLGAVLLNTLFVWAQSEEQISACFSSLKFEDFSIKVSYNVDDDTHFYNSTRTYDAAACTMPTRVPVNQLYLQNVDSLAVTRCDVTQFDGTGRLYSACRMTLGQMARTSRDDGTDWWASVINIGVRPATYQTAHEFQVEPVETPEPEPEVPTPEPSGNFRKRKISIEAQHKFDCLPGQSYCWTGVHNNYACMDVSSDVSACGACPYSEDFVDCSAIEGVSDVQCRNKQCVVNSCERGFQVRPDRSGCTPHIKARKRSYYK